MRGRPREGSLNVEDALPNNQWNFILPESWWRFLAGAARLYFTDMRKCLLLMASALGAQSIFTPGLKPFIAVDAPVIALEHVRVIDGTGASPREDQTIVIANGRIQAVGAADEVQVPAGA